MLISLESLVNSGFFGLFFQQKPFDKEHTNFFEVIKEKSTFKQQEVFKLSTSKCGKLKPL